MKKLTKILAIVLVVLMTLSVAGCGKKNSLVGTWEYSEDGIGAVYDLKKDGTGTYKVTVGEAEVEYELKYEVKDNLLLVRFVNNDTFSEDDVFENEFNLKDANTLILKDTSGLEMTFVKK